MIKFFVPLKPIAKGRPRFGKGKVYTPKKTHNFETTIGIFAKKAMKIADIEMYKQGIAVSLVFRFKPPKSQKKKIYYTKKPDLDNLIKSVLDGCQNICYEDDRLITNIFASKCYDEIEGIDVLIEPTEYLFIASLSLK